MQPAELIYHDGDRIRIIADHLLLKGSKGTITKWVHDNVYVVKVDGGPYMNGRTVVLKNDEMQHD
jgi:hypothetical protein